MASFQETTFQLFCEEAAEHLAILEEGLLQLERDPAAAARLIDRLFRSAHTIKGSAALLKLQGTSAVAHRLEDTLEALRDGRLRPSQSRTDALLFALDQIKVLISSTAIGEPEPVAQIAEVERRLREAEDEAQPAGDTTPTTAFIPERRQLERREGDSGGGFIRVATGQIDGMMGVLGEITVTKTHLINQLTVIDQMKAEIEFAGQRLLREVTGFADRFAYALPETVKSVDPMLSEFQELEFDRYDEMNLFARNLQEITNDIHEALRGMSGFFTQFTSQVETMDRMVGDMKERISEARTIRAGTLFQRFTRPVRDLARQSGLPLELQVAGEETLLDRTVYDGLYDPLLHILRNAVAHGFESADERATAGKPESCALRLTARRRGNTVEVEVGDDGRGLQFDRIRRRAEAKGLLAPGAAASERELIELIFQPGFSTTETADAASGRGVGMNVVMDRLAALNGTIEVESATGRGTTFRLAFPLSLVIVNVIQFRVGPQAFVIPSTLVREIVDLPSADASPRQLTLRGEIVATVDLTTLFALPGPDGAGRYAIVTQAAGRPVALLVDAILSQEDTVIRPFDSLLRELPGFAGTSIAGDGTLRLVVSPTRLPTAAAASSPRPTAVVERRTTVLVVDDSLSVRRYAAMLLEAHGIEVLSASQGFEALELLDNNHVDMVITDLEMPLMHGYELLGELGRRGLLATLPAAVLTSRAGDQHREKARALGACDYLVKPFEEDALLDLVRRHTTRRP